MRLVWFVPLFVIPILLFVFLVLFAEYSQQRVETNKTTYFLTLYNKIAECPITQGVEKSGFWLERGQSVQKQVFWKDEKCGVVQVRCTPYGYSGKILTLVWKNSAQIKSRWLVLEHQETPGIGALLFAQDNPWFVNNQNFVELQTIDAKSGATITSTAVGKLLLSSEAGQSAEQKGSKCQVEVF